MSHMVRHESIITATDADLNYVDVACKELGLSLQRNQQSARYYAGNVAACDHAIHIPGTRYEVGLQKTPDGTYALLADHYDPAVTQAIGPNGSKLIQHYNVAKARATVQSAKAKARTQQTAMPNGVIRMKITVPAGQ